MDYCREDWKTKHKVRVIHLSNDYSHKIPNISYRHTYLMVRTKLGRLNLYNYKRDYTNNTCNKISLDGELYLDNTYVSDLANPTVEELDYLELLFGSDLIDVYRHNLAVLKEDLC